MSEPNKAIKIASTPKPNGPYSQAIVAGNMIFTSGIGASWPIRGAMDEGIEEQTRHVLRTIDTLLREHGSSLKDVVKATVHLQHIHRDFDGFSRTYAEFFTEPYPVRTTLDGQLQNILVEIDVIAVRQG